MKNKKNISFEEQWESAFKDAAETPPVLVWEAIELELNKEKTRKPFLFFWKNPWLNTGIAAALLIIGGYVFTNIDFSEKTVSSNVNTKHSNNSPSLNSTNLPISKSQTADLNNKKTEILNHNFDKNIEKAIAINQSYQATNFLNKKLTKSIDNKSKLIVDRQENKIAAVIDVSNIDSYSDPVQSDTYVIAKIASNDQNLQTINGIAYQEINNSLVLSPKFLSFEIQNSTETMAKIERSKMWFGINSGISPFKTNVSSLALKQDAFVAASNANLDAFEYKASPSVLKPEGSNSYLYDPSQPQYNESNNKAFNLGLNVGKKIGKKLSLESGLRVLRASTNINSNIYAINTETGQINSFLDANLQNESKNNQTIIANIDQVSSSFDYISIPLQLSYGMPIHRNFSAKLLAGFSNDFFIQNNNESKLFGNNSLNPSNSNFKNLTISGLTGLNLQYNFSKHWEASLGSFLQQSLNSGVKNTNSYTFKPRMIGLNYGLNYKL